VMAASSCGTVDQMSVQPALQHQPEKLLGSLTVVLPRRRGRVETEEG